MPKQHRVAWGHLIDSNGFVKVRNKESNAVSLHHPADAREIVSGNPDLYTVLAPRAAVDDVDFSLETDENEVEEDKTTLSSAMIEAGELIAPNHHSPGPGLATIIASPGAGTAGPFLNADGSLAEPDFSVLSKADVQAKLSEIGITIDDRLSEDDTRLQGQAMYRQYLVESGQAAGGVTLGGLETTDQPEPEALPPSSRRGRRTA